MLTNVWQRHFNWLVVAVVFAGLLVGAAIASATRSGGQVVIQSSSGAGSNGAGSSQAANRTGAAQGQAADSTSRPVFGSIAAMDADTMTVRGQQGDAKVKLAGAKVTQSVAGTTDDLRSGQQVTVVAQQDADGSNTAMSIQLGQAGQQGRGALFQGGQGGQGGQADTSGAGGSAARAQGQQSSQPRARPISGTITSFQGGVLSLSAQDGTVNVKAGSARITKMADATSKDLQQGQSVLVTGTQAQDGSYDSAEIEILPAGTDAPGGGAQPAGNGAGRRQQ